MARARYQVLVIPYYIEGGAVLCVSAAGYGGLAIYSGRRRK